MKKILVFIAFITIIVSARSQNSSGNRIKFNYDSAGNQYQRLLCLNCPQSKTIETKKVKDLEPEDLQKFNSEDVISYYPNPVLEELYLKWQLIENNKVAAIKLFTSTGVLLKSNTNLEVVNDMVISFSDYPTGLYFIEMIYSNGEQKTIQIIKK